MAPAKVRREAKRDLFFIPPPAGLVSGWIPSYSHDMTASSEEVQNPKLMYRNPAQQGCVNGCSHWYKPRTPPGFCHLGYRWYAARMKP
ncbi:hypothetical protein ACVWZX_002955 [Deinococcus sp. UYEF24]